MAAARLAAARDVVARLADDHRVLAQNLLASDVVRRLCWDAVAPDAASVGAALTGFGARPWQVELTAAMLAGSVLAGDVPA